MAPQTWISVASISAFLAVAAGAFGAHGLKQQLGPDLLEVFETGARYHMFHALGLGLVGVLGLVRPGTSVNGPAWALLVGTLIFSGSLYLLALTGQRWLGAITPIGGTAFLVGWAWLAWVAARAG
ncbi:MAG: DUF423 domain-containing protein [Myxococcota bacterium]